VSSDLKVVSEAKVDFDADFASQYGVKKGVLTNEAEGEVFAPVAMWLEAVDLVLARLKENKCPLQSIKGISGSCQQHGSVFWNAACEDALGNLDGKKNLYEQLKNVFAYEYGPNWQDHSTQSECDLFDEHLGGPDKLAEVTGSAAHHVSQRAALFAHSRE
jgi:xylulokinase